MPSDCPSKHAGHNRCQDKTKTSDYASLNSGLYGRYRFGSGYSCPASVHRQRNFTPNRWIAFDVLQPKHIDHDNNNSSFPDVSFSFGANFRRAFDSNEIFLKIQRHRDKTTFNCCCRIVLAFCCN